MKSTIYILNKLAKEEKYRLINESALTPLWQAVGDTFS